MNCQKAAKKGGEDAQGEMGKDRAIGRGRRRRDREQQQIQKHNNQQQQTKQQVPNNIKFNKLVQIAATNSTDQQVVPKSNIACIN